ncbi:MAG: formate/nitrite transporter family protein [Rhodothermaceae bacterium]|nr:formate/nitrite transporter family protein [Rhodothermaceae bacterium]
MRVTLDRSESGAPAAGHAVRDLFSTDEIFQRLVATADEEFVRSDRLLFLSGLAAGLSIGLSFVARAAITAETGSAILGNLLYPAGFLLIVLGRYQLFTENTLTPVTLVLTRIASVPKLLHLWAVVLTANVAGAALAAMAFAWTPLFDPDTAEIARGFAAHGLEFSSSALFWKGLMAGWIVASMVWLNHAARETTARLLIVMVLMTLIPSADLFHCIIGSCEALYLVFQGAAPLGEAARFFGAVVLGNTVGGVLLVGILNFAQTRRQRFPDRDCDDLALTWREFMFGQGAGRPRVASTNGESATGVEVASESESLLDQPVMGTEDAEVSDETIEEPPPAG